MLAVTLGYISGEAKTVISESTDEPIIYASQSDWETLPFGVPLYFEYDTLK